MQGRHDVLGLLARHGFIAICIAVIIEELGIPMPIPTDILIVTAGATGGSWERFVVWFLLLSLASATGASGLYAAIRRGGPGSRSPAPTASGASSTPDGPLFSRPPTPRR